MFQILCFTILIYILVFTGITWGGNKRQILFVRKKYKLQSSGIKPHSSEPVDDDSQILAIYVKLAQFNIHIT